MFKSSYVKSISRDFIDKSYLFEGRIGLSDLNKVKEIAGVISGVDKHKKFLYFNIYNGIGFDLNSKRKIDGISLYEFNINGFIFLIVKNNLEFYVLNIVNGGSRLVNRYYTIDKIRKVLKSSKIISGESIIDLSDIIIDDVSTVSDKLYLEAISSIMFDINNDADFLFTYVDRISIESDDLLDVRVGGKTGLFISSNLIHNNYCDDIARRAFLDSI